MNNKLDFEIPSEILDEIQVNIENIIKDFDIPDSNKMEVIKKINFMYTQTRQMSLTDPLTRLFNRRHFDAEFEREFKRAKRYNNPLSVAIIDIDFFKKINDTYGHLCGDFILKEVAYLITENFRQTDEIFRFGGEEFVVILTETPAQTACVPLERLRKKIESNLFKYNGNSFNVTVSIGVSSNIESSSNDMLEEADKALYEAKSCGRNSVKSAMEKN